MENYPAALLYNDQSVQEKQALQVAFTEFLKPDYEALRRSMFGSDDATYRYFRTTVVAAVMSTDLTSPEQTVVTKSKWKEAFCQPQQQLKQGRKGSLASNISMPLASRPARFNRRGSNSSDLSDVTTDMYSQGGPSSPLMRSPRRGQTEVAFAPRTKKRCAAPSMTKWIRIRRRPPRANPIARYVGLAR